MFQLLNGQTFRCNVLDKLVGIFLKNEYNIISSLEDGVYSFLLSNLFTLKNSFVE